MQSDTLLRILAVVAVIGGLSLIPARAQQNVRLVDMVAAPVPPVQPVAPVAPGIAAPAQSQSPDPAQGNGVSTWWDVTPIGDQTRALLSAQVSGGQAGEALPTLGAPATAAWDRYLKSFEHPIPEWFQERIEKSGGR